jgi:hypothetical protein
MFVLCSLFFTLCSLLRREPASCITNEPRDGGWLSFQGFYIITIITNTTTTTTSTATTTATTATTTTR